MQRSGPCCLIVALFGLSVHLGAEEVTVGSPLGRIRIAVDATQVQATDAHGQITTVKLQDHPGITWADRLRSAKAAQPQARVEALGQVGLRKIAISHQVSMMPRSKQVLAALAERWKFRMIAALPDHSYVVEPQDDHPLAGIHLANALAGDPDIVWAEAQLRWPARVKATPNDPLFTNQWALSNDGSQANTTAGVDIRATLAWDTARGVGKNVAIVDSGIEYTHPDLSACYISALALDLFESDGGPAGPLPSGAGEEHGTVTAGLAVARGFNGVGMCGAAPSAGLAPVRLIVGAFTDTMAANALRVGVTPPTVSGPIVDVSSNSWGEADDGVAFKPATNTLANALSYGSQTGRDGRGTSYVFAAGNGGVTDDTAYDGYQQYRQVIAVGAVDGHGANASYTEPGANLLVAAPGGDAAGAVSTDQVGANGYVSGSYLAATDALAGTSFAAPLVSGVVALLYETNTALTWRDVEHILVNTARPLGGGFQTNATGLQHHHRQGFGLVDAAAAVTAATTWIPVPAASSVVAVGTGTGAIPDVATQTVSFDLTGASDLRVEAAQLTITVTHTYWADLAFTLTSPTGTTARIEARSLDTYADTRTFTIICRPFWNEAAIGTWTLALDDLAAGDIGTSSAASLTVYGWRPRAVPTATVAIPNTTRVGDTSATITLTGTGFANDAADLSPVSTATWQRGVSSGVATVSTISGTTSLAVMLPTAALAGSLGDTVNISITNPAFAGLGGGTSAPISVTLRANAAPTLAAGSVSAALNGSGSTTLVTTDADSDTLSFTSTATSLGTITFSAGTLQFAAGPTVGSDTVTVTADDGNGGTANATFTVTVTAGSSARGSHGGGGGGGCGAAGLSGVLSVLLVARLRRRR